VETEVELESGQSFVIAGLLDNQTTESLSKVPGIGDIPLLGKLFQSKSVSRSHSELLVIITPEIVRPIPADKPVPALTFSVPQLNPGSVVLHQPGMEQTGPVPVTPPTDSIPFELLVPPPQKKLLATPAPVSPVAPAAPVPGGVPIRQ
jgi:pilus assembly protein CpaC